MKTVALRRLAEINPPTPAFERLSPEQPVEFLPLETVWADRRADQTRRVPKSQVASGYSRFHAGDIVSPKVTPTFQAGRSMIAAATGAGTTELHVLRARPGVDPRWILYVVRSKHFLEEGVTAFEGVAGLQRVPGEFLQEFRVADVDGEEQRRIADFLDERVARIDQIIAARRAQATLCESAVAAVREEIIRGRVTRRREIPGWLGSVDSEWPVRRLGQVSTFYAGAAFPVDEQGSDHGDIAFLKVSDLAHGDELQTVTDSKNYVSATTARILGAKTAPIGTVAFPKVGAALLTNNRAVLGAAAAFDNNVMGVKFRSGNDRFLFHVLSCIDMAQISNPGPVPSVNRSAVADLMIPMPVRNIQNDVAKRADQVLLGSREQQTHLRRSVAMMREYKQSLITAAVTGELDVTTASTRIPGE